MTRVSTRDGAIEVAFDGPELELLRTVVDQYLEVARDDDDPAATRLYPDAYPDDPERGAEFRELTRTDLRAGKIDRAGTVLADLAQGSPLALTPEHAEQWTRALTDVRLVLAHRLGVADDETRPEGLMGDVYLWLGEMQWLLLEALDEADADA